jgi:hypothetical protein
MHQLCHSNPAPRACYALQESLPYDDPAKAKVSKQRKKERTPLEAKLNSQGFGALSLHAEASNSLCSSDYGKNGLTKKRV